MNTSVDDSFFSIAKDIVERLKENPDHYGSSNGQVFVNDKKNKDKSGCC
jgi:hypothetical protein